MGSRSGCLLWWGRLLFGISLGSSTAALIGLSAALAFAATALGLLVAAVSRTREQTLPLSLATTLSLAALGGLWWPISLVPDWLHEAQFRALVSGYQPSHPKHGGGGAFYVRIRRIRER